MSLYLEMWDKINELTPEQREAFISILSPVRGRDVKFFGIPMLDVDLVESLKASI